jgi:IS30 family transposase
LKHRKRPVGAGKSAIPNRLSIHDGPAIIEERKRFGDWEMDLIQGANTKQYILTLVESSTRFLMMQRLENGKAADEVAKAVVDLLLPYKHQVHSITTDNGMELAKHDYISRRLSTTVYFTDPYSS